MITIRVVAVVVLVALWSCTAPVAGTVISDNPSPVGDRTNAEERNITERSDHTIDGRVTTSDGEPVANATVSIPLATTTVETTTDDDGRFTLDIASVDMPDEVVIVAKKSGYLPQTKLVAVDSSRSVRFELREGGQRSVVVSDQIIHIGDGDYTGSVNSQFQTATLGEEVTLSFTLNDVQANADDVTLRYAVRGAERANRILLNGREIGITPNTPEDGSQIIQELTFPAYLLEEGENELVFEGAEADTLFGTDIDDFEISNVQLLLEGVPRDKTAPSVSLQTPDSPKVGKNATIRLDATDNNKVALATLTLRHEGEVIETRTTSSNSLKLDTAFTEAGAYTVSTQVTDQSGNVEATERTFNVSNVAVRAVVTDPPIPRADGTTDIVIVVDAVENISSGAVVKLEMDGSEVSTKQVNTLRKGHNAIRWTNVSLEPGAQRVTVTVQSPKGQDSVVGSPSVSGTLRVPPLAVEKVYTEPVPTDAGEAVMTAGDTHTVFEVSNPLNRSVEAAFTLVVDGEVVSKSQPVTLAPGASQRLLFAWNAEPERNHELSVRMQTEGESYAFNGTYKAAANGMVSRKVPTELVRAESNPNIRFSLRRGSLGDVMVTKDPESGEIQAVNVPYSAPSEMEITVVVKNLDGEVIGETETTASGRFGSVSVPVDMDEDTEYIRIEVTEQGTMRDFLGKLLFGYTGASALMGLEDAERGHFGAGTTYSNAIQYRGVMVAQVSGYPPNDEFIELQNRVAQEERLGNDVETVVNIAGVLLGGASETSSSGALDAIDDVFTANDFVTAAKDTVDLSLNTTSVSFDASEVERTNEVGEVYAAEFDSKPAYVIQPTRSTAMQYLDVKATGLTGGDAGVEVAYSNEPVEKNHLKEETLDMKYWKDGEWRRADNVSVDTEANTVSGEIAVSDLNGTPIVIVGEKKNIIVRLLSEYGGPGLVLGVIVVVLFGMIRMLSEN